MFSSTTSNVLLKLVDTAMAGQKSIIIAEEELANLDAAEQTLFVQQYELDAQIRALDANLSEYNFLSLSPRFSMATSLLRDRDDVSQSDHLATCQLNILFRDSNEYPSMRAALTAAEEGLATKASLSEAEMEKRMQAFMDIVAKINAKAVLYIYEIETKLQDLRIRRHANEVKQHYIGVTRQRLSMQILQADKVAGSAINQIERILGVPIPEGKRTTAEWKRWWQNTFFAVENVDNSTKNTTHQRTTIADHRL